VVQILMLIGIVRSAVYFYSSIFRAAGKPSWRFGIYTLTGVMNVAGFLLVVRLGIVAVAASYVVVSYLLMPLYFLMIRKLISVPIWTHVKQYIPALLSSLILVVVVLVIKYFLGQNFTLLIRLVIFVLAGVGAYLLAIRFIRPSLYSKMLELAQLVWPGISKRQN
jgi:O-antigen/teichoic acid export membrane protein